MPCRSDASRVSWYVGSFVMQAMSVFNARMSCREVIPDKICLYMFVVRLTKSTQISLVQYVAVVSDLFTNCSPRFGRLMCVDSKSQFEYSYGRLIIFLDLVGTVHVRYASLLDITCVGRVAGILRAIDKKRKKESEKYVAGL